MVAGSTLPPTPKAVVWDVFIAYASADKAESLEAYNALTARGLRPFLDRMSLPVGAQWPVEIPRAQDASKVTLVLVPAAVGVTYYLQEEIATAIMLTRDNAYAHRVVPVWLGGPPNPTSIPYGLRQLVAIDLLATGWNYVASTVATLIASLPPSPSKPPTLSAPRGCTCTRIQVYDALCALPLAQFEGVRFRSNARVADLVPSTQAVKLRAIDLIEWAEVNAPNGLCTVEQAVRAEAPHALHC